MGRDDAQQQYLYKPDVKIDGSILPSDGKIRPFMTGYQWSKDYPAGISELDQIRCDTKDTNSKTGCVFVNSAPTYVFNAKRFPQATAHAWMVQKYTRATPVR